MSTDVETVTIDRRFRGPLHSANGGYACGLLGSRIGPAAEVTLRLPPPLERPLTIRHDSKRLLLEDGDLLVAEASRVTQASSRRRRPIQRRRPPRQRALAPSGRPSSPNASSAACATTAAVSRSTRGPMPGREGLVATTWVARGVSPEVVWASIDCPGAYAAGDAGRGEVVLGRMTARIDRLPEEGELCVVVGWPLGEDGRKLFSGTALYGRNGTPPAVGRQVSIAPR